MESAKYTKWEYKRVVNITMRKMSELGQEGWELAGYTVHNGTVISIFKRPIINIDNNEKPESERTD